MNKRAAHVFLMVFLAVGLCSPVFAGKGKVPYVDFGPTGIVGTREMGKSAITVAQTESGSPADGKLKAGDVIVGINGERTSKRADEFGAQLTKAVQAAEATDGKLTLNLAGDRAVVLELAVLGAPSSIAPYDCPRTDKIVKMAADAMVRHLAQAKRGGSHTQIELLGLMATGEKAYIDAVSTSIRGSFAAIVYDGTSLQTRQRKQHEASGKGSPTVGSWSTAYATIALAEYFLLTKDETIFPALKTYALSLVEGQDPAGLYGHKMTDPETKRAPGYGQMNQVSIACYMGMLLAKTCGVDVPGLPEAIERSQAYVEYHIGQGGFAYGFHGPRAFDFNNNGTSGSAAICMALAGNKEGAAFFSGMAATSGGTLGSGHASSLFSTYWTPAGAHVAGPQVTQRFFPTIDAYLTPRRKWDGSFVQGYKEGHMGGVALLAYCLPRRALLITGREADRSLWLDDGASDAVVNMSKLHVDKTPQELLSLFGHENPVVRTRAIETIEYMIGTDAKSLKKAQGPQGNSKKARKRAAEIKQNREAFAALFPRLQSMLASGTPYERMTALRCYLFLCPEGELASRMATIATILRDTAEPDQLRVEAVRALSSQGAHALPYVEDLLTFLVEPRLADRYAEVDAQIAEALDPINRSVEWNPYAAGLVKDRALFYEAAIRLMKHKRQNFRGTGVRLVRHIPREELPIVIDELEHILKDDDRTYHSYHNPSTAMAPAAQIFVDHDIREGIGYIADVILDSPGKFGMKIRMLTETLPRYGANAKPVIPKLMENKWIKVMYAQENNHFLPVFEKMVKEIETDTNPPTLITVEEIRKERAAVIKGLN